MKTRMRHWAVAVALVLSGAAAGCDDTPTDLGFEVIEELEFAASLNIDLATFDRRGTGVYWKDLTVGTGEEAVFGTTPSISFRIWLSDGTLAIEGTDTFLMGNNAVISGLEDGILRGGGGGTRLLIIPPNRGYAGQGLIDINTGAQVVPPGAVLVFEVTLDDVELPT